MRIKKIIAGILLISTLTPNLVYSQSSIGLVSVISPAKYRGYLHWEGNGSAKYLVEILERNSVGNNVVLSSKIVETNYTKMDPLLFTMPNVSYKISGLDNNNLVLSEGDVIPNELEPNAGGSYPLCKVKCNGRSYAWSMTHTQKTESDFQGGQIPTTRFVQFWGTSNFHDEVNGIHVPYYQAFSSNAWVQLGTNNSPYRRSSTSSGVGIPQPLYARYPISSSLGGGPFYDKDNIQITDGYIIEKKLDQFQPYVGWNTDDAVDPGQICIAPINGVASWTSFFNDNKEGTYGTGIVSDWTNYFPTTSDVYCMPSNGSGGGSGVGSHGNFEHSVADLMSYFDCILYSSNSPSGSPFNTLTLCTGDYMSPLINNDNPVTGVTFGSILNGSTDIQFANDNGRVKLISDREAASITKGLYWCNIYTANEGLIPTVFEFESDMPAVQDRDLVKLEITPNPTSQGFLDFTVKTLEDLPVQVRVFNLMGELIYSASESLASEQDLNERIDISNLTIPFNQLRISLIFEDGTVIQETALTVN